MKRWTLPLGVLILMTCLLLPSVNYTEDRDTITLARAIYAVCGSESYEAKLALGTVVMNRVENAWFPGTTGAVLTAQHQFPIGRNYDSESLKAAHAVISGTRTLPADALYYHTEGVWRQEPVATIGSIAFYDTDGNP